MYIIKTVGQLYRGQIVRWKWQNAKKTIRPMGIVITRIENPFGRYDGCPFLVRCLDDPHYCISPKFFFEKGNTFFMS